MCALCGSLAAAEHWSDTQTWRTVAAERQHRLEVTNRFLSPYGLTLSDWAGRLTLASRTGAAAIVDAGTLWPEAERLAGRPCDPLDEALLDVLERKGA